MALKLVFLIPGLGGSDLRINQRDNARILYPVPSALLAAGPRVLGLKGDGLSPLDGQPELFSADIVESAYHQLRVTLSGEGILVKALAYDWRKSMRITAPDLAGTMKQILAESNLLRDGPVTDIYVVGHSMGGLMARLAWFKADASVKALWRRTVCVGTPHGGSYNAAQALSGRGNWFSWFCLGNYLGHAVSWFAQTIKNELVQMVRTWPSIYEHLPNTVDTPWAQLDPNASFCYNTANYSNKVDADAMNARFLHSDTTRQWLREEAAGTHPERINVIGRGHFTPGQVVGVDSFLRFRKVLNISELGEGDETVVVERATQPGVKEVLLDSAKHLQMVQDQAMLDRIKAILMTDPATGPDVVILPKKIILPVPVEFAAVPSIRPTFFPAAVMTSQPVLMRAGDP